MWEAVRDLCSVEENKCDANMQSIVNYLCFIGYMKLPLAVNVAISVSVCPRVYLTSFPVTDVIGTSSPRSLNRKAIMIMDGWVLCVLPSVMAQVGF